MANCPYKSTRFNPVRESGNGNSRSVIGSLLLTATVVGLYLLGWKIRQLKRKLREVTDNDNSGKDKDNCKSIWGTT
jgi:hypothetical protein